jgi:hypothetical protein
MSEITDEALQLLYWACRHGMDFPGNLPIETEGMISTHAILEGLGLVGPIDDGSDAKDRVDESANISAEVETTAIAGKQGTH